MDASHLKETVLTSAVRCGIFAAAAMAVPGWVLGAPQGGQVVAGSASIDQQGRTTTITQSTAKSAIDWQSFSIGTQEYVQFVQPGTTAVTLNRVIGNDPSQLLGQMTANGQIFLVNPNGVYFGPNAVIDVAGLLATTFNISNDDFMAGRYHFARLEDRDPASVVNDGTINADGGYVILAGDGVINNGLIEAYLGDIVLSASERINLDLGGDGLISYSIDGEALTEIAGVENTGALYADGGRVFMTAQVQGDLLTTAVNHEGLIQAQGVQHDEGGVYLVGIGGDVNIAGHIDADATVDGASGGRVIVQSNGNIAVRDGATLTAQGSGSGDGGVIRLIAADVLDVEVGTKVDTTGGSTGQGGFIEISGHEGLNVLGSVSPGSGGQLLVDPSILYISTGGNTPPTYIPSTFGGTTYVYDGWIENQLNNNVDLTLVASNNIDVSGEGPFAINASGTGDLTIATGTVNTVFSGATLDLFNFGCSFNGVCGDFVSGSYGGVVNYGTGGINLGDSFTWVNFNIGGALEILTEGGSIGLPGILNAAQGVVIGDPTPDGIAEVFVYSDQSTVTINGGTSVVVNDVWSPGDGGRLNIRGGDLTIRDSVIFYWPFGSSPGAIDIQIGGTATFIDSVIYGESLLVSAGGDILLNGDDGAVTVSGEGTITLTSEVGTSSGPLTFQAGGSILVNYATDIWGYGVTMVAGNRIDLTLASPHVGVFPGFSLSQYGDPTMLSQLASLGVSVPSSPIPNGTFIAPNEIKFGLLEFRGDYLYLQSDRLTFTQDVLTLDPLDETGTVINQNVIVQMLPYTSTQTLGIEAASMSGVSVSGTTYFTQADHFSRFPGTSLLIGGSSFAGPMFIGQNGIVNIGSKNFLGLTVGQVIGASNIQTTGLFSIQGASPLSVTTLVQQTTTSPTDPTNTIITEETVDANLPSDEQTGADDAPLEEPFDFIALLEEQPLVDGQIESNGMVLACR
jgi:filamentous hemagglutinin family protein